MWELNGTIFSNYTFQFGLAGNGAQMVRIFPYAATQFTSFEMYKKLFGEESHIGRFAAGSAAGVTAVAFTYPLDTIRARLAFQVTIFSNTTYHYHVNNFYDWSCSMISNEIFLFEGDR